LSYFSTQKNDSNLNENANQDASNKTADFEKKLKGIKSSILTNSYMVYWRQNWKDFVLKNPGRFLLNSKLLNHIIHNYNFYLELKGSKICIELSKLWREMPVDDKMV
jgi:hypothetical protein